MIPWFLQIREERPPERTLREWAGIKREANRTAGVVWHRDILPDHWQPNAKNRYRHKPRTLAYIKRKQQLAERGVYDAAAPTTDNLATGFMRDMLLSTAVIRATPNRVTIQLTGPRYITMKPKDTRKPHKAAEILTVLDSERQKLAKAMDGTVDWLLNET